MGSWGPKLYQDDIAVEVKDCYIEQLKKGRTNEEVTDELIKENKDIIHDEDDAPIFWFALADTQWNLGRLLGKVKQNALKYLSNGDNLKLWKDKNPKEYKIRQKVLEELETKLNSIMPPQKKFSVQKIYRCEWKMGDTFEYKLESDYAKLNGLYGRSLVLIKVDEAYCWPGHIVPIVYVKILDDTLEVNRQVVEGSQFIKTSMAIGKPQYRIMMMSRSKRVIPKKLIYIGNHTDLSTPTDEYVKEDKSMMIACDWKDFEETMIYNYLKLTLKK